MDEIKRFMHILKNKFYRIDNVMYPAWYAERMIKEAYEDYTTSVQIANNKGGGANGK